MILKGAAPSITSPVNGTEYLISKKDPEPLQLICKTANDVTKVYWYINNKFYKSSNAGEKQFFVPGEGPVKISCTDDKGRNRDIDHSEVCEPVRNLDSDTLFTIHLFHSAFFTLAAPLTFCPTSALPLYRTSLAPLAPAFNFTLANTSALLAPVTSTSVFSDNRSKQWA